MNSWSAGYVTDILYTQGFYRELTPAGLALASLVRGVRAPAVAAPLVVCELGCGHGFSANLLAAANPAIDHHAVDFNPGHIAGARALAGEAGIPNAHFHELAFADLASAPDLPRTFDLILLHGVWSWIDGENRRHITSFIRDRLKPGGLVYISYNALPGWAAVMPLRRLFVDHAATGTGPLLPRIEQALAFARQVVDADPLYVRANPGIKDRLEKIQAQNRNYLAHEYFNRDWTPFYHADVAADLSEAKLTFVGSAHLLDTVDALNLTAAQQALLSGVADPTRRETLRDVMVNQQFRRDLFVKGAVPLSAPEIRERWLDMRFALLTRREDVPMTVIGAVGEATLQPEVYGPILDALTDGPRILRDLLAEPALSGLGWARIVQALTVLVGAGHLHPALDAAQEAMRAERTKRFNNVILERAKGSADLQFLASPVTGGGVAVDQFQLLFLLAQRDGHPDPVAFAWNAISSLGQRLVKAGSVLETDQESITELQDRADQFFENKHPVIRKIGIL